VEFLLTGGQEADIDRGVALIGGHDAKAVIADKGYDGDDFVEAIEATGAAAAIPPKKNRIFKREYDRVIYKERDLAERFINRIKQFRRVATRYEKTARNFLGFVHVAAIMVLPRWPRRRILRRYCPHGLGVSPPEAVDLFLIKRGGRTS
jgi:transposase